MGTTCSYKPKGQTVADYLISSGVLRWRDDQPNTYKVLATAFVKLTDFYAAVERVNKATGEREVWAAVIKCSFVRDQHYNFCHKDMDETMGPYLRNCPEHILDLLTPTENDYALSWRASCREVIAAKKAKGKVGPGSVLAYGGRHYTVVESLGRGYHRVVDKDGTTFRMKPGQVRAATAANV